MDKVLEERVKKSLDQYYASVSGDKKVLVAVSGGVDSIALLSVLHKLKSTISMKLEVITIDHQMRSEHESTGDALFVSNFCASLKPPVHCTIVRLKKGNVEQIAQERKKGEEEAARFLRYKAFEKHAAKIHANCICTGHNQDDQIETILMRILQGGGTRALGGIPKTRNLYLRPLLDTSRKDLEKYLHMQGILWREDATNFEQRYKRNKIRHNLVPFLNSYNKSWEKAILRLAEKARRDEQAIASYIFQEKIYTRWKQNDKKPLELICDASFFNGLHPGIKLRFLYEGLSILKIKTRIPYSLLAHIADSTKPLKISSSGISFENNGIHIFLKNDIEQWDKNGYLVYVTKQGTIELPCGIVKVSIGANSVNFNDLEIYSCVPLLLRSRASADYIQLKNGSKKKINKLYSDWSVKENHRDLIPVVEKNGTIIAVYGDILGYQNFIA